jgi:hypothetical protein
VLFTRVHPYLSSLWLLALLLLTNPDARNQRCGLSREEDSAFTWSVFHLFYQCRKYHRLKYWGTWINFYISPCLCFSLWTSAVIFFCFFIGIDVGDRFYSRAEMVVLESTAIGLMVFTIWGLNTRERYNFSRHCSWFFIFLYGSVWTRKFLPSSCCRTMA